MTTRLRGTGANTRSRPSMSPFVIISHEHASTRRRPLRLRLSRRLLLCTDELRLLRSPSHDREHRLICGTDHLVPVLQCAQIQVHEGQDDD